MGDEYDIGTKRIKTWQERIVAAMTDENGKHKWYTNGGVRKRICEIEGIELDDTPTSFTNYMYILIKNGYVQRAAKPRNMVRGQYVKIEYLYRLTGKPFVYVPRCEKMAANNSYAHVTPQSVELGIQLYRKYKHLPKWFRHLMK